MFLLFVLQHQAYEFQFGAAYAWMMCIFTVVMTYSITCPIIVPFGFLAPTSMFTFVVLVITIVICLSHVCFGHFKYLSAHNYRIDHTEVNAVDGTQNGRPASNTASQKSAKYIAQVLQDSSADSEPAGDSEEPGSQDDDTINEDNTQDAEFQSCEDSLIANEIHQ
ncbi:hypothetical protein AB205_0055170 [Aquarana catesbeiana]|uniref:CSC1/OSCA1-like 7TM region domain-containing protein n=1 Tax=Aquarana catesbeiana TaxID=8400 RepID=A0A2G9QIK2_AQUCT|nr:hypothetical protein AB205_0055170 [Aquarana catesbeiana]